MNPLKSIVAVRLRIRTIVYVLLAITTVASCRKFLDKKPLRTDAIPTSVADLQALLDNVDIINNSGPGMLEVLADDYYVTSADYNSFISSDGTPNYVWDSSYISTIGWNNCYQGPIYLSNIVLDQLPIVTTPGDNQNNINSVKGTALFYRSFCFHALAQLYCKPYSTTSNVDKGLLLKLSSDINEVVSRGTVQDTYSRIINDLKEASELLPISTAVPTRPSKSSAYAALARTYLCMRDYVNAGYYANLSLQITNTLMDFNQLVPVGSPPIRTFNSEVIFHNTVVASVVTSGSRPKIDSSLYKSYSDNDLRKVVFFGANAAPNAGTYFFQGSYHGNNNVRSIFNGLTTGEMYLIRAECYAKQNNVAMALTDLNALMKKRWKSSQFVDITAADANDALRKIRAERRKELVFRGQRWSDIRRYNLEDSAITLKRIINGTTYLLPPNDLRSVLLIPTDEIIKRGIEQNPRN